MPFGLIFPGKKEIKPIVKEELGYKAVTGSTSMGYLDSFRSFGWFGFMKFWMVGWIMGILYRYAMHGFFLGQLLYVSMLNAGMHAVTHHTSLILSSDWVYFFVMGIPLAILG